MIHSFHNQSPLVHSDAWVAQDALVIGAVKIGQYASVWFKSVIRSEANLITIGDQSNIQDGCVLHTDLNYHITIGNRVTIGHGCIIHGCTIDDDTMIGMRATIMNGAKVGKHCIIGAGALVPENMVIPDGYVAFGVPARVIKVISEQQQSFILKNAHHYQDLAKAYKQEEASWINI